MEEAQILRAQGKAGGGHDIHRRGGHLGLGRLGGDRAGSDSGALLRCGSGIDLGGAGGGHTLGNGGDRTLFLFGRFTLSQQRANDGGDDTHRRNDKGQRDQGPHNAPHGKALSPAPAAGATGQPLAAGAARLVVILLQLVPAAGAVLITEGAVFIGDGVHLSAIGAFHQFIFGSSGPCHGPSLRSGFFPFILHVFSKAVNGSGPSVTIL